MTSEIDDLTRRAAAAGLLKRLARAAPLAALLATASPTVLLAQAAPHPAPPPAQRAQPPGSDEEEETPTSVSEVVVTGQRRPQPGAVVGDIKPELQLSPADIQSYGVSTVTELLDELAPETRSDRGRGGESPVVLLNGRRISSFNEIRDIPTEAILRVDILPEEVALKYGYTANQRVVNIVLRRFFRAITGEGTIGAPTEGGQVSGQAELDILHIRRDDRLNLDLKYQASSDLTEADRSIIQDSSGAPFAFGGNVTALAPGTEIDPALSALAGRPITVAGIPGAQGFRPLTLSDFAGAAPNGSDLGPYRTLSPATQNLSANAVLSRTLFAGISGTFNATFGATSSDSLNGLPAVGLSVPLGNAFSPFRAPVMVDRYVDGPLRQSVDGWTGHLGTTLNKDVDKWRLSLTGAYDHAESRTVSDNGVDVASLQALIDGGSATFDPFAPLPADLVNDLAEDRARSLSDGANIQFLGNGPLLQVPAGQLYASLKVGDTESWFSSTSDRLGFTPQSLDFSRNDFNAQLNLDLPLTSVRYHVLPVVGDLSVNVNAAVDELSDFGVLTTLGYGVNWTPVTGVNLIVSRTNDQAAPSAQQLGNPLVLTSNVRILDFVTGRTVEVTRIDGGNAGLVADNRDVIKVGLTVKPFSSQDFTFSANYIKSRIDNPIATFPAATAAIEAAFPDRFKRDADGELTEIDYRPVNFARQDRSELRWGFNFSMPIGPQPPPRQRRWGSGDGPGRGGWRDRGLGPGADGGPGGPPARSISNAQAQTNAQGGPAASGAPGSDASSPPPPPDDGGAPGQGRGFGGGDGRRGGGFGGGRGGFGGRGGPGGRLQFAVFHTVFFDDRILVRAGGPTLDLLNGAAAGGTGGQPRHEVEAQAGYLLNGLGARLSADWRSGTEVIGAPGSAGDLNFSDLATVNLRLFANFGQMPKLVQAHPWFRGSRLTLSFSNLFDARMRVRDANGQTPLGYQAAYLDPAGRVVRLSFRKLFF